MKHEIRVPEVSEGVTEGIVASIAVSVGDTVEEDQALLELETDKAVVEIPSPRQGRIAEIKVSEGDTVDIGAVIMLLETDEEESAEEGSKDEGEKQEVPEQEPAAAEEAEEDTEVVGEEDTEEEKGKEKDEEEKGKEKDEEPEPAPAREDEEERASEKKKTKPRPETGKGETKEKTEKGVDDVDLTTARRGAEVAPASPSVRRFARELGVDIYRVRGSGPGGRISEEDVRSHVRETMQQLGRGGGALPGSVTQRPLPDFGRWGKIETEALSRVREVTAETMSHAWSTVPMVAQQGRARVTALEAFRKDVNEGTDRDSKLTVTAILVKICAAALAQFPRFNSSLDLANRQLILKKYIHIGVAVDTEAGLLVPVLRDADKKDILTLAKELNELAERTRNRKVGLDEMEGGCFTISNLGGIGRDPFTPIVYPPQVAILGVARARTEPVWNGSDFVPEQVLPLTLTYDHRVIDGADGARFMQWLCRAIEYPLQLVMKR